MESLVKNGIYYLWAKGSEKDIAKAHFELFKEEIKNGAIKTLSQKTQNVVRESETIRSHRIKKILANGLVEFNQKALLKLNSRDKELISLMAKCLDITEKEARCAYTQGETFNFIASLGLDYRLEKGGCSSLLVYGDKSTHGGLLHARNFDYPIVGSWEKFPFVMFVTPENGYKYATHTTLGVHTNAVTTLNEKGITCAIHFHPTKIYPHRGISVHAAVNEIVKKAATISEAINVLQKNIPYGSWTIIVGSNSENRAVALEIARGEIFVFENAEENFLARSNLYEYEKFKKFEISPMPSFETDAKARLATLKYFAQSKDKLNASDVRDSIASLYDPYLKKDRITGNNTAVITNVGATVLDAKEMCLYVSTAGKTPASTCDFNKISFFDSKKTITDKDFTNENILKSKLSQPTIAALDAYSMAFNAYHEQNNIELTLKYLKEAATHAPNEGAFTLLRGILFTHENKLEEALNELFLSIKQDLTLDKINLAKFFIARVYDLQNERERALLAYKEVIACKETPLYLKKAANKYMQIPFAKRDLKRIKVDLQYHDCLFL